jgi:hypothetical protein
MQAIQGEFNAINQKLNLLRQGQPIDGDKYGLIRNAGGESQEKFCRRVVQVTQSGPQAKTYSTWLKGFFGGGKTQVLYQLEEALGECAFGEFKVLVCKVNLNQDRSKSVTGFHLAIFESASALSSEHVGSRFGQVARGLVEPNSSPSGTAENVVKVGWDILRTALPFPAPGVGTFATLGLGWAKLQWDLRRGIKKMVAKLGFKDKRATELMVLWTQYSLSPNEKRWIALDGCVQRLAEERSLFFILTHILKKARYATVVIMIDQAENLAANRLLTDELTNIYDRVSSRADRDPYADLNLFFVFATTIILELRSTTEHGGFVRRFLDPDQCESIEVDLVTPIIDCSSGNDIDRIQKALIELNKKFAGLPIPDLTDERVRKVRRDLAKKRPVTWSTLWKSMLSDQFN